VYACVLVYMCVGRVNDMINREALSLVQLKLFVLDEADEMLSRGFQDQVCVCVCMCVCACACVYVIACECLCFPCLFYVCVCVCVDL